MRVLAVDEGCAKCGGRGKSPNIIDITSSLAITVVEPCHCIRAVEIGAELIAPDGSQPDLGQVLPIVEVEP